VEIDLGTLVKEREELRSRLEALEDQIRAAKEQRRQELLRELAALGFSASPSRPESAVRVAAKKGRRTDDPCRVCGFKTTPLHDARSHRGQNPQRPFSDDELARRNFVKV
jgi:DNA repair exonuclease SbcCD ATPase subunit